MKERIRILRKKLGLTQDEFAKKLSLSQNFIAQVESGKKNPSERTILDICREFHISYLWITKGIEPMEEKAESSTMAKIDNIMVGENETAKKIFKAFSELDDEQWKVINEIIKKISKEF